MIQTPNFYSRFFFCQHLKLWHSYCTKVSYFNIDVLEDLFSFSKLNTTFSIFYLKQQCLASFSPKYVITITFMTCQQKKLIDSYTIFGYSRVLFILLKLFRFCKRPMGFNVLGTSSDTSSYSFIQIFQPHIDRRINSIKIARIQKNQ